MDHPVSLNLSSDDLAAFDAALDTIRRVFSRGTVLTEAQRDALFQHADRSHAFCRQTLTLLLAHPHLALPALDPDAVRHRLEAFNALRPRVQQLRELLELGDDIERVVGDEVMDMTWEAYALLRMAGKEDALEPARRNLGSGRLRHGDAPEPTTH